MSLADRVAALEKKVASLEAERRTRPVLVSEEGICGVEPAIDSATCPFGSLYRRRKGCLGVSCKSASAQYYEEYRSRPVAQPQRKK